MNMGWRILITLSVILASIPALAADDDPGEDPLRGLEYRLIGPSAGGRVSRVAGVPEDPLTYYAATAAGGVWKSVNGGGKWTSIFDDQSISSIGSIAVAPSDPNVIWVGSGEANIRGNVGEGNGIYRSTDAGATWSHVWTAEGQIGTIAAHPDNPDVAFAAVLGSPFGPGSDRGVFRTTDGGESWRKVLFKDEDTGASDVCFHPSNPRILFAGLWQTRRTPWGMTSGGPGSGLYVSRDSGDTWEQLEAKGLPEGIWGRVGVRVSASEPDRVYALIEADEGGLFRSDDGGKSWKRINPSRGLRQRAWYYSTLTIDPDNADVVWFPQVAMIKTIDGGRTVRSVKGGGWRSIPALPTGYSAACRTSGPCRDRATVSMEAGYIFRTGTRSEAVRPVTLSPIRPIPRSCGPESTSATSLASTNAPGRRPTWASTPTTDRDTVRRTSATVFSGPLLF